MDFSQLVRSRYSVRSFQKRSIEEDQLALILEAGRLIPSAHNTQPQKIYVAQSQSALDKLASVCPCTFGAPLILVVGYDKTRERKSRLNPGYGFGENDAAIACTQMMLQAHDLGIGSCWVGMFKREDISRVLELPEEITVIGLLPLGYPAEDAKPLPLHFDKREKDDIISEL